MSSPFKPADPVSAGSLPEEEARERYTILDDLRSRLPRVVGLGRYAPDRDRFSWDTFDPSKVGSASDLPPYLILGALDHAACEFSGDGWSARWQGRENDTYFHVTYQAQERRYEMRQAWCGVDGGFSTYPASIPIAKLVSQTLYMKFPSNWDTKAKETLERRYQLTYIEHQQGMFSVCGIPDGAVKTIAFPVAARDLKGVFDWLLRATAQFRLPFPFFAYARPLFQAVNYLEGRAPDWTSDPDKVFNHSVQSTGLIPAAFPMRESASDGSAAWTLRRVLYVVFIGVPFAGLTDMLERLHTPDGPIRYRDDPELSFDLQPFVFPSELEAQTKNISFWDKERTTRCFWLLQPEDEPALPVVQIQAVQQTLAISSSLVARVEEVSAQQLKFLADALKGAKRK